MADLVKEHTGREPRVLPFGPGLVAGRVDDPRPRFTFVYRTTWGAHKRLRDLLLAVREVANAGYADQFVVRTACDPSTEFARSFAESAPERELTRDPVIDRHLKIASFAPRLNERLDADAVVVPSTTESFCFPIAEAIGANLPVAATDSRFARELCGDSALFVRPESPQELAEAMVRLIEGELPPPYSPEVQQRISWPAYVDGLAQVCGSLVAR
jgi:glycosyltransferase involved in cell wall biosynthesis